MDTFFQVLAVIIGPLAGILVYTKYVETIIRRTFGTKDAMKLAKPIALS